MPESERYVKMDLIKFFGMIRIMGREVSVDREKMGEAIGAGNSLSRRVAEMEHRLAEIAGAPAKQDEGEAPRKKKSKNEE
ncbi:hypothetical protein Aduo_008992 [Ancylostoma duodenale]